MKRDIRGAGRFLLVAAASLLPAVHFAAAGAAQMTLSISSWTPPTHLMTKDVLLAWARDAETATQGRVKFQMLPKHPSAPPGTLDAIRDGLTDVSFAVEGYLPARFVLSTIAELPGGGATAEINSVAYSRIHARYLHQAGEFRGVKLLAVFTQGPGHIYNSKRPINALADLQGLKIRTGGGIAQKMAAAMGASSFVKPATETYELLSTGIADGVFFTSDGITSFRLDTIIKYATLFPGGFYSATFSLLMNEDKWNKLAKADQDAITSVSGERLARRAGKTWDAADQAALEKLKAAGVNIAEANAALIQEVRAKATAVEQEWIRAATAKGVDGAKVLAEFRAELKKVEAGQ